MASPTLGKDLTKKGVNHSREAVSSATLSDRTLPREIFDLVPAAIFAADERGNITAWNKALSEIYDCDSDELIGKDLTWLFPQEGRASQPSMLEAALQKGSYLSEIRIRTKSGKDVYILLSLTRICVNPSAAVTIAGILVDLTEYKLRNLSLSSARAKQSVEGMGHPAPQRAEQIERQIGDTRFLIASPLMHKFMTMVDRIAGNPEMVLITGETGSGKELIARSVHDYSTRRDHPWVDINCAALPEHLVESELFGYEKGAFSGADSAKPGLFELADKGTLFLDEIGELDPKLQVKLLRVLDGAPYYRLGGHRKITVDVRVVSATNQDLDLAVKEGRFRRDLFHRLSQLQLRVPPLRERPEDVVALAQHFLAIKDCKLRFDEDALSAMACYRWPGNVRELRNLVAKLVIAAQGTVISAEDLLLEISTEKPSVQAALTPTNLEGMEEQMIIKALESMGGHRGLAAEQLGISRRTLSRKLREYNITCADHDRDRALGSLGVEQQKFFRAKATFPVRLLTAQGEESNVTAVNLSTGGLGIDGLAEPHRLRGLLDASFLLPGTETLIQAKVRLVWADAAGRAGIRFVVVEPALFEEIQHWTARKMKEEGWDSAQA